MSGPTMTRPSALEVGDVTADYVVEFVSESPWREGEVRVRVRHRDGGLATRVWDEDRETVPVLGHVEDPADQCMQGSLWDAANDAIWRYLS